MNLSDVKIYGLPIEDTYHGGYGKYSEYRMEVAKAFNKTLGEIYENSYYYEFPEDKIEQWNQLCNDNLDIFLFHGEKEFTPEECGKIYNELKKLKVKDLPYSDKWTMHELWLNMFKYCYTHKVNMWFY